jgi:hypothetical protein
MLVLPAAVLANDSTERLAGDVGKLECAKLDAAMQGFLQQNREHLASLSKLAAGARVRELESYRKALMRAEDAAARCAVSKKGTDAKLTTVGANPNHIIGFYPKLNATIDYVLNSNSSDPFVFEQLTRSYDDLLDAYKGAKK